MDSKVSRSRSRATSSAPLNARNLLLASIGAVLCGRREALRLAAAAGQRIAPLAGEARRFGDRLGGLVGGLGAARKPARPLRRRRA
ncbi:MAG: hypothetical protein KGZ52_09890 [Xanthomonadaceae bacterium]|jgi:hypothetical protein|nr:hypothetical protein [Xanthomonadaceae bacterium]MBS3959696.1 hypothetical protein [Xanthomonadaceae bacterium]